MANANSTALQTLQATTQFVSIPALITSEVNKEFSSYIPIVLMDGEYNNDFGVSLGKSIRLKSLQSEGDALEAARIACLSTPGAIGYAVRGVDHE